MLPAFQLPNIYNFLLENFHLNGNVYWTDIFDIIVVTLIVYSAFEIIRKTKSYRVLVGAVTLLVLFLVAKQFNLYMTYNTLQYLIGASVVIFVIIFQNEIRKYFEFVGLIGTRRITLAKMAEKIPEIEEIIQACVKMAQNKIGALIVIEGKDNIDPYLEGGVLLDGVISEEVLLSIFDPTSEGHDGALVIRNNRIFKFGTHLPLSTNFKEIGKHGTRHSAALGLSESADALSIVVSEEKGKISFCRDGRMKTLNEFADTEKELNKYIKARFSKKPESIWLNLFKNNLPQKVAALALSMIIWFFYSYQAGIVEKKYNLPLTIDGVPKDVFVESYMPKQVSVVVRGRGERSFSNIRPEDFKVLTKAADLKDGVNKINITNKDILLTGNLSIVSVEPNSFLLTAKKYYTAEVPIKVITQGELRKGYELKQIDVTPEKVQLLVPENVSTPEVIETDVLDITNQTSSVIIPINLKLPKDVKTVSGEATANAALTIEKVGD